MTTPAAAPARSLRICNAHSVKLPPSLAAVDLHRAKFVIVTNPNGEPLARYELQQDGVSKGITLTFSRNNAEVAWIITAHVPVTGGKNVIQIAKAKFVDDWLVYDDGSSPSRQVFQDPSGSLLHLKKNYTRTF